MTFYDIDGTPYGPKEYAADKTILNQAEIIGSYVPYEVKRRVADYEKGYNPFDRKYERRVKKESESKYAGFIIRLITAFGIFFISLIIGGILSLCTDNALFSDFFGNIFPFLTVGIYILYILNFS